MQCTRARSKSTTVFWELASSSSGMNIDERYRKETHQKASLDILTALQKEGNKILATHPDILHPYRHHLSCLLVG